MTRYFIYKNKNAEKIKTHDFVHEAKLGVYCLRFTFGFSNIFRN